MTIICGAWVLHSLFSPRLPPTIKGKAKSSQWIQTQTKPLAWVCVGGLQSPLTQCKTKTVTNSENSSIQVPHFLESLRYTTSFYQTPMLVPVFTNQMKSGDNFCFYGKKRSKSENSIQHFAVNYRGSRHPKHLPGGATLSTSASGHHCFELWLWESVLYAVAAKSRLPQDVLLWYADYFGVENHQGPKDSRDSEILWLPIPQLHKRNSDRGPALTRRLSP